MQEKFVVSQYLYVCVCVYMFVYVVWHLQFHTMYVFIDGLFRICVWPVRLC